jgi:hypothetical protein
MKVLSIDVGIKNLAFCLFTKDDNHPFQIVKWDIVNLSQETDFNCCILDCGKPAKFTKNNQCYCLKHAKKQPFKMPTAEVKPAFINKQKIQTLHDFAAKYDIKYEKPIKKQDLVSLINKHLEPLYFDSILKINASQMNLITIGRNIKIRLDEILDEHITTITNVIIENQISPIANRMKTIQGMIAQYFIMRNSNINIEFISSINKLKDSTSTPTTETKVETTYKDRKLLGIKRCLELLRPTNDTWKTFFSKHTKKDDLADAFLQGMWYLHKQNNQNK